MSLSGDGGDELFAGYNRHAWLDHVWQRAAVVPAGVRRTAGSALGRIPPGLIESAGRAGRVLPHDWQVRNPSTKVVKLARVLSAAGPEDAYRALSTHWTDATSMVLGTSPGEGADERTASPVAGSGITEQMLWLDLVGYLPDDILAKLDRAAMAVSLETRVPFLDRRLLDLAWRLPLDAKLRGRRTKWLLRQVLERHVPAALVDRPKMGFGLPIGSWLRGELAPWAEHLLSERRLHGAGPPRPRCPCAEPGSSTDRGGGTWATSCGTCWSSSRGSIAGCRRCTDRRAIVLRGHDRACAVTISMMRAWSATDSADPVGRQSPCSKIWPQCPGPRSSAPANAGWRWSGFHVGRDSISASSRARRTCSRSAPKTSGIDADTSEPVVGRTCRRARHG